MNYKKVYTPALAKKLIIFRDYYVVREVHIANLLSLKNANAIIFEIL